MTVDMDAIRKDYERQKQEKAEREAARASAGSKNYWKKKEGLNTLRIVPIDAGNGKWYKQHQEAWVNKRPICPPSSVDPEAFDPYIEYLNTLRAVEGEQGKRAYNAARPTASVTFFAIDRDEEDKGPKKVTLNQSHFDQITELMFDFKFGNIADPVDGFDLIIKWTKQKKDGSGKIIVKGETKISAAPRPTPLASPEVVQDWMSKDLFKAYRVGVPSEPEYITAVIEGTLDAYFAKKKAERENAGPSEPAEEAPPVAPQTSSVASEAADVANELDDLAPKFFARVGGVDDLEPKTLTVIRAKYGQDVEVRGVDQTNWTPMKDLL